jgi:hypothetical protein
MEFEAQKNSFNGEVEPCQTRLTAPQQWWVSKGVNMIFFPKEIAPSKMPPLLSAIKITNFKFL